MRGPLIEFKPAFPEKRFEPEFGNERTGAPTPVLTNVFHVNSLNQLTSVVRTNTSLTVAGTTTSGATNVTVNSLAATRYADNTFTRTNITLSNGTNTFTAIAQDNLGRADRYQCLFCL